MAPDIFRLSHYWQRQFPELDTCEAFRAFEQQGFRVNLSGLKQCWCQMYAGSCVGLCVSIGKQDHLLHFRRNDAGAVFCLCTPKTSRVHLKDMHGIPEQWQILFLLALRLVMPPQQAKAVWTLHRDEWDELMSDLCQHTQSIQLPANMDQLILLIALPLYEHGSAPRLAASLQVGYDQLGPLGQLYESLGSHSFIREVTQQLEEEEWEEWLQQPKPRVAKLPSVQLPSSRHQSSTPRPRPLLAPLAQQRIREAEENGLDKQKVEKEEHRAAKALSNRAAKALSKHNEDLSPYEQTRLSNIAENDQALRDFGLAPEPQEPQYDPSDIWKGPGLRYKNGKGQFLGMFKRAAMPVERSLSKRRRACDDTPPAEVGVYTQHGIYMDRGTPVAILNFVKKKQAHSYDWAEVLVARSHEMITEVVALKALKQFSIELEIGKEYNYFDDASWKRVTLVDVQGGAAHVLGETSHRFSVDCARLVHV